MGAIDDLIEVLTYGEAPKIKNQLYSEQMGRPQHVEGDVSKRFAGRNVRSVAELEDIIRSGFMQKRAPGGKKPPSNSKYFTMSDAPSTHVRVPSNKVPVGQAVSSADVELLNKLTGQYSPIREADFAKFGYGSGPTPRVPTLGGAVMRGLGRAAGPLGLAPLPIEGAEALLEWVSNLPANNGEAFGPLSTALDNNED